MVSSSFMTVGIFACHPIPPTDEIMAMGFHHPCGKKFLYQVPCREEFIVTTSTGEKDRTSIGRPCHASAAKNAVYLGRELRYRSVNRLLL